MRAQAVIALSLMLVGCLDLTGDPSRDEVAAATSPDGALVAVLFETNGGATTSYGYEIEVWKEEPDSVPVAAGSLYGAVRSECSYGVNLRWSSARELVVEFMEASRIAVPASIDVGDQKVMISPRSNVTDKRAPCGSMLAHRR